MMESGIGNRELEIPRFPIRPPGPGIAVPGLGIGVPRAARRGFPGLVPRRPPMQTLPLAAPTAGPARPQH